MVDRLTSKFVDFYNLILYNGEISIYANNIDQIQFGYGEIEIIYKDKFVTRYSGDYYLNYKWKEGM
jgi:hypothetical protein